MKVIYVNKKNTSLANACILCLGNFDGLHLGHQYIIKKVIEEARSSKYPAAVLTFRPHPGNVLNIKQPIKMLMRFQERLKLLERLGVDLCYVINFDKQFSKLTPKCFIRDILIAKINPGKVIVGRNFRFGKNGAGDIRLLANYGFRLKVINARKISRQKISSSLIRRLLEHSRIEEANRFLGRSYSIQGEIVSGRRFGRRIGFPTLNINYDSGVVLPLGIFSGFINIAGRFHRAAINIGFQPTLNKRRTRPVLEVHVLRFKKNIFNKKVEVFLTKKIRSEKKFSSILGLKRAIKQDLKKISASKIIVPALIKKLKKG
ncbi:MAG: bifunctional riboflavin kinase/FAD synthetase [Candidatus Omnitrophica bacterium]|nr:bifunctional riboflavin kinase/FAD synthetase [Candidatus Omnitrophota bacterium]